jgi:polyribonucleotide nucleotidyltransferase
MSTEYVKDPSDVVQIGDKVKVRVKEVDDQGRINLSMLFGEDAEKKEQSARESKTQERRYEDFSKTERTPRRTSGTGAPRGGFRGGSRDRGGSDRGGSRGGGRFGR